MRDATLLELAEQDVEAGDVYALENNSLAYYRAADGSPDGNGFFSRQIT